MIAAILKTHRQPEAGKQFVSAWPHPDFLSHSFVTARQVGNWDGGERSDGLTRLGLTEISYGWTKIVVIPAADRPIYFNFSRL